jgi:ribonucleotide reductase alpha subunit
VAEAVMDQSVDILDPISQEIWDMKYRFKEADGAIHDQTIEDTWWRVARAVAEAEKPSLRETWASSFYGALSDFKFLSRCSTASSWARSMIPCSAYLTA